MSNARILKEATIAPNAVNYNLLGIAIALSITILGIPLLVIVLPLAHWYWNRYYANLKVILTTRELKVHRGIFNREEKSIPLEKITDLAVFQGPIMRKMDLKGIRVETAGQSTGAGALVRVVGIHETDEFRDLVLTQRDRITDSDGQSSASPPQHAVQAASGEPILPMLVEIRDTLVRLESHIKSSHRD